MGTEQERGQFLVNDYKVDLPRNQISRNGQVVPIPKKSLAVLALMAENAGSVVSQETIMQEVWGETIVAPNSLQRCIAQLRKALGDDSKQQSVIKTHSKQGYSLVANVEWVVTDSSSGPLPLFKMKAGYTAMVFAVLLACVLVLSTLVDNKNEYTINVSQVAPLTASDDRETNPRFSPDGKYLVFHRYKRSYSHHLWAMDLDTKQEIQLTQNAHNYGSHSWSVDGNQLTFSVQKSVLNEDGVDEVCWQISTLDFAKALKSPQPSVARSPCMQKRTAVARWLENGSISVLQKGVGDLHRLYAYDIVSEEFSKIYEPENSELYSYDFSLTSNQFAVASRNSKNQHFIEKLNRHGDVLSKAEIQLASRNSAHEFYNIYFDPSGEYLLTSTELGVYQLFFDGRLVEIDTLGHRRISDPILHPDGQKLVAVQESGDQDIAIFDFARGADLSELSVKPIARSNTFDALGKFQPNGSLLAYISNRTGLRQIWLYDGERSRQLGELQDGVQSIDFVWSPSGKELALITNDQLTIVSLEGSMHQVEFSMPLSRVMQWMPDQSMLVVANQDNKNTAFLLNMSDLSKLYAQDLGLKDVRWAQLHRSGEIIYVNSSGEVWRRNIAKNEEIQIERLKGQLMVNRLVLHDGNLYGINQAKQLWRYTLEEQSFTTLAQLADSARYVSDVKLSKAVITHTMFHYKEIIEFQ